MMLGDPFFVQWLVHVAVVSLFAILGVWWATSRLPWYVPPTVMLALLWLFVPLEAPEPAVVLLVATPLLAATCRGALWLAERRTAPASSDAVSTEKVAGSSWRFRLSDSLWLMFLCGLTFALAAQLWRLPWATSTAVGQPSMQWFGLVVNGVFLIGTAAVVLATIRQRTLLSLGLGVGAVIAIVIAAVLGHAAIERRELLLLVDWELMIGVSSVTMLWNMQPDSWEVFEIYLRTFSVFAILLFIGTIVVVPPVPTRFKRTWMAARLLGGCVLAASVVGLGIVYAELLDRPEWPAEKFPARNRRGELKSIVLRHAEINPQELSLALLRASGTKGATTAQSVDALYQELDSLLQTDEITLFDSRTDVPSSESFSTLVHIQAIRGLARSLSSEAKAEWAAGRRNEALKYDLLCLKLGTSMQRRSTTIEALVGAAVEGIAVHHLVEIRQDLSREETVRVRSQLRQVLNTRESTELLIARDVAYSDRAYGWRERLDFACRRLLDLPPDFEESWRDVRQRCDASVTLLDTELALRDYHARHDRWPNDLSTLVPTDLNALPIDPHTDDPLKYRLENDGFALYSVGKDGDDDGGLFGNMSSYFSQASEHDFDLDTLIRP